MTTKEKKWNSHKRIEQIRVPGAQSSAAKTDESLGLSFLACTLAVGATEGAASCPPIAGSLEKSSHLQAAQFTFRHFRRGPR